MLTDHKGDAIYHPTLGKLFQINFVDHDEPFHQLDNNPVYKMQCRLFDYGSEVLDIKQLRNPLTRLKMQSLLMHLLFNLHLNKLLLPQSIKKLGLTMQPAMVVVYYFLTEQIVMERMLVTILLVKMKRRVVSLFFLRMQQTQVTHHISSMRNI